MEEGSIEEVTARLKLWCSQPGGGLARVEWDSAYARQEVVSQLKASLGELGISLDEISLPPGQASNETVLRLIEKLRSRGGSVISITDVEWAFPEGGSRLDTLRALNFQRETLASLPVRQIWWIPSHLTGLLILGIPDLDSWFQLRLHLKQVPPQALVESTPDKTVSVSEARSVARRFWERLETARAQGFPEDRIWAELAEPALKALQAAGLAREAQEVLMRISGVRELLERNLEEAYAALGEEDATSLFLADLLAALMVDQGDYAGARMLQQQMLKTRRKVLGEEHRDTLNSMNNLAVTLRLQGDLKAARQIQEQLVEVTGRALGKENTDTLAATNNLATILVLQGDLAEARRLQEGVLEVTTRALGQEHRNTLTAMDNLATTLSRQGDLPAAQLVQERVRQGRARVLGEENPDTLRAMNNLALTLRARGDLAEARRLEERVLEVSARVLGEEHPSTLQRMSNLAVILGEQCDFDGSLKLLRKCLVGRGKVLGKNHPDTIAAAEDLKAMEDRAVTSNSR